MHVLVFSIHIIFPEDKTSNIQQNVETGLLQHITERTSRNVKVEQI